MRYSKDGIIDRKLNQLAGLICEDKMQMPVWQTRTGIFLGEEGYADVEEQWSEIKIGDTWNCYDNLTRWFKTTVTVPEKFDGKMLILDLEFGGEAIVSVNGKVVSALTSLIVPAVVTRTRVYLTDCAAAGTVYEISVEAHSHYAEFSHYRKRGCESIDYTFRTADLAVVNPKAESYYFDILTAYNAMKVLRNPMEDLIKSQEKLPEAFLPILEHSGRDPYYYEKVKDAVISSITCVDFDFNREQILTSLDKASRVLYEKLDKLPKNSHFLVKFVGQAHIDTAWLWPVKESIRKTIATFSNACALMDRYPDYTFAFSQPQLFEFAKENAPEVYERVKEKVASGNIELVGNTWVEMDTNVPSGESLVRQILYGRQFFLDEFGKCSDVFWMPDVFGYSWALPQIIKRSGMKYFFTSKLINNDDHRFPHSLFMWQGIDGTRIPAYLQRLNYNGQVNADTLHLLYSRFDQKDVIEEAMMTFGFGDGGGGPTYQMLETAERLKNFPGLPKSEMSTSAEFFADVEEVRDELPVWNDEMYYEFHRGTYTSQADVKKGNRKIEFLFRDTEMMNVFAQQDVKTQYPYEELLAGYKKLLTNQFHDILPGSSIKPVYDDTKREFAQIGKSGQKMLYSAADALIGEIAHDANTVVVFNFLSWERNGYVSVDLTGSVLENEELLTVYDADGNAVLSKHEEKDGKASVLFYAENLPAMGYRCYRIIKGNCEAVYTNPVSVSKNEMENRYFKISLDADGNITGIYDKKNCREVLCGTSNLLKIFEDKPAIETAWNIELEYQNKEWVMDKADSVEVICADGMKGVLRVKRSFNNSVFCQDIVIYADSDKIDFENSIDWYETEKMLKAEFNVDVLSSRASYEIQFGTIERSTHENTTWDRTKFEMAAHKWADLSEGNYGVSLLNDCKYGYDIKNQKMRITLLRSPIDPDPSADKGHHEFVYSLYPHGGNWIAARTVQAGYELNTPMRTVLCTEASEGSLPAEKSYISVKQSNVVIDTIKASEDESGIIVRVYESSGSKTNAVIQTAFDVNRAVECNLVEEEETAAAFKDGRLEFVIRPFEVKTFKLMK